MRYLLLIVAVGVMAQFLFAHPGDENHHHAEDEAPAVSARERASAERDRTSLRVMSFNIRYHNKIDGENIWENRDTFVAEVIHEYNPDLLGLQEAYKTQVDFLKEKMRGYRFHGVGRTDGKEKGEYNGIFFRAGRFKLLDSGHFWLSETPEVPSKSWDSALSRMVSWVKLKDQQTGETLVYMNTHFDHRGQQARVQSAKVLRKFVDEQPKDARLIITGDFNAEETMEPYEVLVKAEAPHRRLRDTYREIHANEQTGNATFHAFKGNTDGRRIDWILVSEEFEIRNAGIDRSNREGKYPSDHYPVTAELE